MKANFASYCPIFLDEDLLYLNSRLAVRGQRIYDSTTGALHCLRPEGAMVISQLAQRTTFKGLRQSSTEVGIHSPQLTDLLGFLNLIGCIERARPWSMQPIGLVLLVRRWRTHKPLYKRTHTSLGGLLAQTLLVCWPIIGASTIVSVLGLATGILSVAEALEINALGNTMLIVSIYLHEVAHFAVLRSEAIPTDTVRHGLRIGLLHRSLDPVTEIFLAMAGPISGMASCALGFLVCKFLGLSISPLMIGVIVFLHLCSLLPWYGDGASLRLALHARKS